MLLYIYKNKGRQFLLHPKGWSFLAEESMKKFHDTLVLNRNWVPCQIVDFRKTMSTLYTNSAHALDREYLAYDWQGWIDFTIRNADDYAKVHTAKIAIAVPEIIVLTRYDKLPTRDIKFSRENIINRDKHTCQYCGKVFNLKDLTLDHIIPKSRAGKTIWENITTACKPCNNKKDNKTPSEAGMKLIRHPTKPSWINPITGARGKAQICKSWEKFMNKVDISEEV